MAKFDYSTLTDLHFFLLFVSDHYFRKVHTIITSSSHGNVVYYHQKRLPITVSYIFCVSIAYESLPSFYIFSNSLRLLGVLDPTRVKVFFLKRWRKKKLLLKGCLVRLIRETFCIPPQHATANSYFCLNLQASSHYCVAWHFAFHNQSLLFFNI